MINVPSSLRTRVVATYGTYFAGLSGLPAEKIAFDALDEDKIHDQVEIFCRLTGRSPAQLRGKKLLEVGSGFGIALAVLRRDYGVESYGIEPASEGFDSSFETSREILAHYGLDPAILLDAKGEDLPFPDNHFDLIFSSTVLEHTQDPELVLAEAIRVLKPEGHMQFVYPNYGSFFDGHYAVPWIPYQPHWLARRWIRLLGRNPAFVDTLQLTNYWKTRRWLRGRNEVEVLTYGQEIFEERMLRLNFKNWAGVGKTKRWLQIAHQLHLIRLITWLLSRVRSFEPIILTLRKKPAAQLPLPPDNRAIYDIHWPDWLDMKTYGPASRWLRSLVQDHLHRLSVDDRPTRVLDVGCGEGSITRTMAQILPGATVLGIDRAAQGIRCAQDRFSLGNLAFACREETQSLPDGSYDLVTCFEVLEHVEDWRSLTRELARLSSRYLLVSFPTGRMRPFEPNIGHLRNFRRGQFERYAASIGLEPVDVYYAGFPFYSPLFRELCNVTNSGGNNLTIGRYNRWQKMLSAVIYRLFRFTSTRRNGGDQFCGLFRKSPGTASRP